MSYCPRFWGFQGDFHVLRDPIHFLEFIPKTRSFCVLWPFSRAIAHNFGVRRRFAWLVRPDTCLRVMTKNSSFSRFMVVFMSYCPQFWDFRGDLRGLRDPIHVRELGPKNHSFRVLWPFS